MSTDRIALDPFEVRIEFSARLRAARREAGLSQRELAEALHTSQQWVSKWETDIDNPPSYHHLRRLCIVLGVTARHLLCLDLESIE